MDLYIPLYLKDHLGEPNQERSNTDNKKPSTKGACLLEAGHTQGKHNTREILRGLPTQHPNPTKKFKSKDMVIIQGKQIGWKKYRI